MATLERQRTTISIDQDAIDLTRDIPTPFPTDLVHKSFQTASPETGQAVLDHLQQPESSTSAVLSSKYPRLSIDVSLNDISLVRQKEEVRPTLVQVEQSCLMTLNNLLAYDAEDWQPIVPTRRHSMPAQSPISSSFKFNIPSSSLHTLVGNIRNRHEPEANPLDMDMEDKSLLLEELSTRITSLIDSGSILSSDALLVQALLSLLTHISRVSDLSSDASHPTPIDFSHPLSTSDLYDTLRRQVSELQSHRGIQPSSTSRAPIEAVEHAILWHKIDDDLDEVFRLCRERTEVAPVPYSSADSTLPPEYEIGDYEPPTYNPADYSEMDPAINTSTSAKLTKMGVSSAATNGLDEKMRLDFEAITMAIDRLYMVAPQLLNQRVELNRTKIEQMERARLAAEDASISSKRKGKAKDILGDRRINKEDIRELEKMLELINRASSRRLDEQSVVLDGERGMAERVEKARLREIQKRDEFHAKLVSHSNSRRLTSQDAEPRKSDSTVPSQVRIKNPNVLLTLPEFIKETVPEDIEQTRDPQALLTLPEFVRETPAVSVEEAGATNSPSSFIRRSFSSRSRSLSAPPISLVRLLSGSSTSTRMALAREKSMDLSSDQISSAAKVGLDVHFVAECQDTLGSVAVFLELNGTEAGANVEAEVFPGGRFIIKCGTRISAPLALPAKVKPGKREVGVQSGHFELKLECLISSPLKNGFTSYYSEDDIGGGLLDATQLKELNPTSFICASCSLPLVHGPKISRYNDLPSQHWAELLEAWMCHSDQKMTSRVSLYANGLWPSPGQALVGGSYILFDSSSIVGSNVRDGRAVMVSRAILIILLPD
ncbi:hypothetical protein Clacol_009266 [Clathrus columnatus]|uniref:Uncharacterized protein n=1 Tax=Clathrus columnatus TaxID=1419009 RepID=A0AAV5ASW6_9AGAM|nr:hypothetical protein Clacol_009266 [Clathrus columnatus]